MDTPNDWALIHGKVEHVLARLPPHSVDAVVTDPPYGLEFSGEGTGGADVVQITDRSTNGLLHERGFKHGVRFGHGIEVSREFQRWTTTWAHELLRIVRPGGYVLAFGHTRLFHRLAVGLEDAGFEPRDAVFWAYGSGMPKGNKSLEGEWEGWGTHLKPAVEPIVLARKPIAGNVQDNMALWGTAAINIDGCRVGERWPTNLLLDDDAAVELDRTAVLGGSSTIDPSKFFYCAKPSEAEKREGLDGDRNDHPTRKPLAVMRWLARLACRPGGVVLDPFAGSGTTGVAAVGQGMRFVGIDMNADHVDLARRRITHAAECGESDPQVLLGAATEPLGDLAADDGGMQMGLFG